MAPQTRAGQMQDNLKTIARLRPADAERVFARVPDVVAEVNAALSSAWLDARHEVSVTEALAAEVGMDAVREINVAAMQAMLESPLLRSLWQGAVKLFGLKPSGILRWSPQFWNQLYRDCGRMEFNEETGALLCTGLPAVMMESKAWHMGMCGALEGVIRLCGKEGRVTARVEGPERLVFQLP